MLENISDRPHSLHENLQSISADLVTKIKYKSICITGLKFENQTNETIVSCGSNIYGRLTINLQPQGRHDCLRQVVIGVKEIGAHHLLYSEKKIIGKRLEGFMGVDHQNKVYESYLDYPKDFQIRAPNAPGLYELEVCLIELAADPIANAGTINGFFQPKEQDLEMFTSGNAADILWNLNDQNCKISMGRIRVI